MSAIYLDGAATTQIDPRVLDAMRGAMTWNCGNPGSDHLHGRHARLAVGVAGAQVAKVIGAQPDDIIWTSGATEADNLAILGLAQHCRSEGRRRVITYTTEHKAVLEPARRLEKEGFDVVRLNPREDGLIDLEELASSLDENTAMVSVMAVNNETGVVQDLEAIGDLCASVGAMFHTDAAQGFGSVTMDVEEFKIDAMSISGHKIYGPKGVGALYLRGGVHTPCRAQMLGGGQQGDRRSGTLNVHGIVGLGEAAAISGASTMPQREMAQRMLHKLREGLEVLQTCEGSPILDGHLHVILPGVDTHRLLDNIDPWISCSRGSACLAGKESYVLTAMGLDPEYSASCLRMRFGRFNTIEDVDTASRIIVDHAQKQLASA